MIKTVSVPKLYYNGQLLGEVLSFSVRPSLDNPLNYLFARKRYAARFGTVPGSERTSRLRKKRRKALNKWLDQEANQ